MAQYAFAIAPYALPFTAWNLTLLFRSAREAAMSPIASRPALMNELKSKAATLGLTLQDDGQNGLSGTLEAIRAKWILGGRKVIYRMSCRPDDAEQVVLFREAVFEKSWGLPPPTLTVEKETISGWKRSGQRTDLSVGGHGAIDYAMVRTALEEVAAKAGWRFLFEGGRAP
jgi:hypothetical protein